MAPVGVDVQGHGYFVLDAGAGKAQAVLHGHAGIVGGMEQESRRVLGRDLLVVRKLLELLRAGLLTQQGLCGAPVGIFLEGDHGITQDHAVGPGGEAAGQVILGIAVEVGLGGHRGGQVPPALKPISPTRAGSMWSSRACWRMRRMARQASE